MLIAKGKLFAYGIAIERAEVGIPSCCETSERRKGYDRVVGPARFAPSVPIVFGAYAVRSVVHVQLSNAQAGNTGRRKLTLCMNNGNFFAERHSAQRIFHPFFNGRFRVQINRFLVLCLQSDVAGKHCCKCNCFNHR